jgi:ribose/xylose/arabinose/galactoside ABC-type transport system permease subunit
MKIFKGFWKFAQTNNVNIGVVVSAVILFVVMSIMFPHFLTLVNMEVLGMGFIQEAIMALGMTLVIISWGIDISISAILPFSAIILAVLFEAKLGMVPAILLTLLAAGLIGFANGTMINQLRVHPLIVTLATWTTLKGINMVITSGATLYSFPPEFSYIGQGRVLGLPVPIVVFVVLAVTMGYLLKNHRYFQQVYFIGGNSRAARLSGIQVESFLLSIYTLNAVLAGVAGIITASQYITASVGFGQNMELRVITAVFIGGASTAGGKGSIIGTVTGVFFLAVISNAFVLAEAPAYWQDIVNGIMLLGAVFLDGYFQLKRKSFASELRVSIQGGELPK